MAVHAALIAGALAVPARASNDEPIEIAIDVVAPPEELAPAPAPPPPVPIKLARNAHVRPTLAALAPPPPQAAPVDEPPPEAPASAVPEEGNETGDVAVPAGPAGTGAGTAPGSPNGVKGGTGTGAALAAPSAAQRKSLLDGYLSDVIRPRIQQKFQKYPAAAVELELTGQVLVEITVDRHGRLLAARLAGRCPHALLCEHGLWTLRASAPFPPPPAGLGESVRIEVPLTYDF